MKTTIEIPDGLAAEARDLARSQRSTLRDLVVTGLRRELERRREVTVTDFQFPAVAGEGLVVGLSSSEAIAHSPSIGWRRSLAHASPIVTNSPQRRR